MEKKAKKISKRNRENRKAVLILGGTVLVIVGIIVLLNQLGVFKLAKNIDGKSQKQLEVIEQLIRDKKEEELNQETEYEVSKKEYEKKEDDKNSKPKNAEEKNKEREALKKEVEERLQRDKQEWAKKDHEYAKKAIEMVKKEVNNSEYVYEIIDLLPNSRAIVIVKNPKTTEVLEYYIVDPKRDRLEIQGVE